MRRIDVVTIPRGAAAEQSGSAGLPTKKPATARWDGRTARLIPQRTAASWCGMRARASRLRCAPPAKPASAV